MIDIVGDDNSLKTAVGKLGDVTEHTQIVAAILGLLYAMLPIKRLSLTGVIEPATDNVPASTFALQSGARLAASTTVRTAAVPSSRAVASGDYMALCSAAAVWAQYEIARELGSKLDPEDADSYRLVREGLQAMDADDLPRAASLFDAAIAVQPRNWTAHANSFAVLHALSPDIAFAPRIKGVMDDMRNP